MADDEFTEQQNLKRAQQRGRRQAVSAPSVADDEDKKFEPKVIPKSSEELQRIKKVVSACLLFKHLEKASLQLIIDAMFAQEASNGDVIIQQGDEGDNFYIVDSGILDIFVTKAKETNKVMTCKSGDSFGELALMYDAPRAATVKVSSDKAKLWAIDRCTYQHVMKTSMLKKREDYESFLKQVPFLAPLKQGEISRVADCLESRKYDADKVILREGETGQDFFIIQEGKVRCTQKYQPGATPSNSSSGGTQAEEGILCELESGQYFGEIALLVEPHLRRATVTALIPTRCLVLSGDTFSMAMGPLIDILKRNVQLYKTYSELVAAELSRNH